MTLSDLISQSRKTGAVSLMPRHELRYAETLHDIAYWRRATGGYRRPNQREQALIEVLTECGTAWSPLGMLCARVRRKCFQRIAGCGMAKLLGQISECGVLVEYDNVRYLSDTFEHRIYRIKQ